LLLTVQFVHVYSCITLNLNDDFTIELGLKVKTVTLLLRRYEIIFHFFTDNHYIHHRLIL